MTKRKVRRVKNQPTPASPLPDAQWEYTNDRSAAAATPSRRKREVSNDVLRKEYAYVISDLRRTFIIAAAMFALLLVLGAVL